MRRIFISAGHGAGDPGAVANGRSEASVVTEFRDLVAGYLEAFGVHYAMDGLTGVNIPLRDAVKMIRPGDIAVEFHLNAASHPGATGVETLGGLATKELCTALCEVISTRLKIKNRGTKPENAGQHQRLAFVQAGGSIVELFFLTNPSDVASYEAAKRLLAKEIATVLQDYARR